MENKTHKNRWTAIAVLPCVSIEETLSFWEQIGFEISYKQTRPYQYGVVEQNGGTLHFAGVKGLDKATNNSKCLVIVSNIAKTYQDFTQNLKKNFGRVPHSGIPRISRMKPETTRFTLTDVSGNGIIFINNGEKDQETWEKAEDKNQSPLQKAIAAAIRFRDYKEDQKAAAATLDAALRKTDGEAQIEIAEALIIRIDLAIVTDDTKRIDEYKVMFNSLELSDKHKQYLIDKHNSKLF